MTEAAESKTFRLSKRVVVTFTVGVGGLVVEWDPAQPDRLMAKELRRYREARHEMVQRLAQRLGSTVAVVEL